MSTTPQSRSPRGHTHQLESDDRGDYGRVLQNEYAHKAEAVLDDVKKTLSGGAHVVDNVASSALLPVASYCLASIFMTVINKFVVSGTGFSMNFLLLAIQSVVCVACVLVAKRFGAFTFRDFDMQDAKRWFPISLLLVAVIYTGSKSLQYLSISVYTIFKNLTIILIAYGEKFMTGASVTSLTLVSFALMVFSSIIAAATDTRPVPQLGQNGPSWNIGYAWMFCNCIVTAANALLMRGRMKSLGFKDGDTMFYNNLLSIPVLAVATLLFEDWSSANLAKNFPEDTRNFLLFAIAISGAAAAFISYTTAWCIRATSSTTYSMVGALNKLPVAASGMIFFNDPVTVGSVSAVSAGFLAGGVYAEAMRQKKAAEAANGNGVLPMHRR